MKEEIYFTLYPASRQNYYLGNTVADEVYNNVKIRWPEIVKGSNDSIMNVSADEGSNSLRELLQYLEESSGKTPSYIRLPVDFGDRKKIMIDGKRSFSKIDIDQAEIYWCCPKKRTASSCVYDDAGGCIIEVKNLKKQSIGGGVLFELLVSGDLKIEMERQDFMNMEFREVVITGRRSKGNERSIWQVWSRAFMPAMINTIVDEDGSAAGEVCKSGWYFNDIFFPTIVWYRRSELASLPLFDVAMTREYMGTGSLRRYRQPYVICSKKFREWCLVMKLSLDFYPVSLED
jgi:hypothetical protein